MNQQFKKINLDLDPLMETLGLLFQCKHFDENREHILEDLHDLGLDAPNFYEKYMQTYEIYVTEFSKHQITIPEYGYLLELGDSEIVMILVSLLIGNRDLISQIQAIEEEDIIKEIMELCNELFQIYGELPGVYSMESIIRFLETAKISEGDKWQFIRFMQQPKAILSGLIAMVEINREAFELAKKAVEAELTKLLHHYNEVVNEGKKIFIENLKLSLTNDTEVYPSLAFPLSYLLFGNSSYYGLLLPLIIGREGFQLTKEELLKGLKAISDKSKFDILCTLKVKPKYNLEIAEELGLTAATMSHHMGVLLANRFVVLDKHDGKIYYQINPDSIKVFIQELETTFL